MKIQHPDSMKVLLGLVLMALSFGLFVGKGMLYKYYKGLSPFDTQIPIEHDFCQ